MPFLLLSIAFTLWAQPEEEYASLILDHRRALGLTPLQRSPTLDRSARDFAEELASRGELSHRDHLQRGVEFRASALGPGLAGEVLGYGPSPESVFAAWLASPTHRHVLETPAWTRWGIGTARWGSGLIVVAIFWGP